MPGVGSASVEGKSEAAHVWGGPLPLDAAFWGVWGGAFG